MKRFATIAASLALAGCATVPQSGREQRAGLTGIQSLVARVADREGVPRHIALGLVSVESRFQPHAVGAAGELGLVQIKHASARGIGFTGTRAQLFDPETNATWGMRYLRHATRGRWDCAGVSSYQRGRASSHVCTSYGRLVMTRAEGFR